MADYRELSEDEATDLWLRILEKWGADGNEYWLPIGGSKPEGARVAVYWVDDLDLAAEHLRRSVGSLGTTRVIWLSEGGPVLPKWRDDPLLRQEETDLELWNPMYGGLERYSTSLSVEWLIYASHESTLAIAGDRLIDAVGRPAPGLSPYRGWSERHPVPPGSPS